MHINILLAMDPHGLIGKGRVRPWSIREENLVVSRMTKDKHVIMGYNAYCKAPKVFCKSIKLVHREHTVENAIDDFAREGVDEVWILGGKHVFECALGIPKRLYRVHVLAMKRVYEGDVYLPVSLFDNWVVQSKHEAYTHFTRYVLAYVDNESSTN